MDGFYSVEIPDLNCATQGEDLGEAIEMAADAAAGWILDALSQWDTIPRHLNKVIFLRTAQMDLFP